jgi:hypothetical protein
MRLFAYEPITHSPSAQGPLSPICANEASPGARPVKDGDDEEDDCDGCPDEVAIASAGYAQHVNDHIRLDPLKIIGKSGCGRIWGVKGRGRGGQGE